MTLLKTCRMCLQKRELVKWQQCLDCAQKTEKRLRLCSDKQVQWRRSAIEPEVGEACSTLGPPESWPTSLPGGLNE